MSVPKPYIFISHSSKDNKTVQELADALRDAGFNIWLDLDSIPDGSRWLAEIEKGVEGCSALVVVMSKAARASEWVERETLAALNTRTPLFIAYIEDVPLPLHLIDRQYTDFRHDKAAALQSLIAALRAVSGPGTPAPSPQHPPAHPTEDNFFKYLEQMDEGEHLALIARDLYYWGKQVGDEVDFGGKHTPGFHVRLKLDGDAVTVFSVWAYMRNPAVQVPFDQLAAYPPYDGDDLRRSTLASLNLLLPEDDRFEEARADRRPTLSLLTGLDTADKLETFKQMMQEMIDNLRSR